MENETKCLDEIRELSNQVMVATEAMLPFERAATLRLRAAAVGVQLDTEMMQGLLSRLESKICLSSVESKEPGVAFVKAGNEFIWTLKAVLSDQKLGSLAQRLRNTEKNQHQEIIVSIDAVSRDLQTSLQAFDTAFKAFWLPIFLNTKTIVESRELVVGEYPQPLSALFQAFHEHPFAIGSSEDAFIRATPNSRNGIPAYTTYQHRMGEAGIAWSRAFSGEKRTLHELTVAQNAIFTLAWAGTLKTVANIDSLAFNQPRVNFSEMALAQVEMSNKLRDSILRFNSSKFSIVFVGTENSGKSTFLNAFVGVNLLPTGDGPTTSYPVRIHHTQGKTVPVLALGVATLNKSLERLRKGDWLARITVLMDDILASRWGDEAEWRGSDLPIGFDFERLKIRWAGLGESMVKRLAELTGKDFKFVDSVTGAENILNTLRDINDFVRICRSLPIGFDHFAPEEWPIISLEFPTLRDVYDGPALEIVDIPVKSAKMAKNAANKVFQGYRWFKHGGEREAVCKSGLVEVCKQYQWDEMLQQTIRAANSIVGIVSLRQFGSHEWEELPRFIARGTNVRASTVIVTMRDRSPLEDIELESHIKYLKAVFWPYFTTKKTKGKVLLCSATLGTAMQVMRMFLEKEEELPDWDQLWTPALKEASNTLFPGQLEHTYSEFTLGSLRDMVDELYQSSGLSETINATIRTLQNARKETILDESKNVIAQSKRVAFDLRRMLTAVGKALGDVENRSSDDALQHSNAAIEVLDCWDSRTEEFLDVAHTIISSALGDMVGEVEKHVLDAMLQAWHHLVEDLPTTSLPDPLSFKHSEDINRYMEAYEDLLRKYIPAEEQSRSQEVLEELEKNHQNMFSRLRVKVDETDPSLAKEWPGSLNKDIPTSQLPFVPKEEVQSHVQEQRATYSLLDAFKSLEQRIFRLISKTGDTEERFTNLQTRYKWLLAATATLPFILMLPYWLRKTYVESYRVRVNSLRACLLSSANARSSDIFGQIEKRTTAHLQTESALVVRAVSSKFSIPEGYSVANALPHVTPAQLHMVTAAAANFCALNAAIGWIQTSVEGLE